MRLRALTGVGAAAVAVVAASVPTALGATAQPVLDRSRADQRWAVSAALQSTDLPGGWNVWTAPHNPSTSELVLACKRFVPDLSHTRVTGIRASSYVVPAHTQVSHLVASFATARDAGRLASADFVPFYQRCLRTEIGEKLASGAKVQAVTRRVVDVPAPTVGLAYRTTIRLAPGVHVVSDKVLPRRGRRVALLIFTGIQQPFDPPLEASLIARASARLVA